MSSMKCNFCGHKTGKAATHRTTEYDDVCRDCAIEFELILQLGDEYQQFLDGQASPELLEKIASERASWEAHFAEQSATVYSIPDELEPLENSWPELKIEKAESAYHIEIRGTAYDGIRYFWKLIATNASMDYLSQDRLFESQGQALDDALEFLESLLAIETSDSTL